MTPQEIETAARQSYNAIGDSFWSQAEIFNLIYMAELELVEAGLIVERTFTTSTVISQQEYSYPTNMIAIERVTYDGKKLAHIDFPDDDLLTGFDADTTNTGTPLYYTIWNRVMALRPIPDAVETLEIFAYCQVTLPTVNSTLEVDTQWHPAIVDYVRREMVGKDQNWNAYDRFDTRWQVWKKEVMKWKMKKQVSSGYPTVRDIDSTSLQLFGIL